MKILILTYQGDLGGATRSMSYLARGLAGRGHEVYFGCRREARIWDDLCAAKVHLVPMEFGRFGGPAARQIDSLCRENGIQIINAQSSQDRYAALWARLVYRTPARIVFTRRQMPDSSRLSGLLATLGADRVIAVSGAVAEALAARWVKRSMIEVVYNGTPKEKYEGLDPRDTVRLRERLEIQEGATVIGCIARKKRQDILLEALPYLPSEAIILIVGPGRQPEWDAILDRIRPKQRVIFLGHEDNVLPLYPLLSVSVLPSLLEGLSQTILESMALGVPVVASRWGGNPEIVEEGESGLLFEPLGPHDLADKVNCVLNDVSLAEKFVKRGRERALVDFGIERTVENTEQVFQRLLNEK